MAKPTLSENPVEEALARSLKQKTILAPDAKRLIPVVPPESENGRIEYKRQLRNCTASRLERLKTQMLFRLQEGNGNCMYRIGIEDDGCHSLLMYDDIAETARILEHLARTLNAVVVERVMIQNEIEVVGDVPQKLDNEKGQSTVIRVQEPSLLGDGREQLNGDGGDNHHHADVQKEEKSADAAEEEQARISSSQKQKLVDGAFTRCELTIQRVETHLLDPSPISIRKENNNVNGKADRSASSTKTNESSSPSAAAAGTGERLSVGETMSSRNIRVAVVGNVDAGKSTMIGTLTSSCLDDGRGSSRTMIMKHRHEIESGRTSTASTHLMGFKSSGEAVVGAKDKVRGNRRKSEDEVARESHRVVTLMDLAGHEKYLKTTIHGVASGMADYALILVNSRHPPTHMTHHHLNLCVSFGIHIIIVFTKVDGCPEHALKTSKEEVFKLLRAPDIGKKPFAIRKEEDIETCIGKLNSLAPVFETSCVSGKGIDLLQKMLFAMPKRRRHEKKAKRPFEFLVEDIFNVPGVGAVVSGFVNAGELTVGATCNVYVGPTDDGSFMKTVAKSAHIARINTAHITSGQSACLNLALSKDMRKKLRRGMAVLKEEAASTREFEAEICVLKGEGTTIRKSYQAYVHILNVRQSAYAKKIEIVMNSQAHMLPLSHTSAYGEENEIVLRPGSRAKVHFEFAQRPEYIRPGMRMLFRDGRVRGVGLITAIPTPSAVAVN